MHEPAFYWQLFSQDDLIYLFFPIFMLALGLDFWASRRRHPEYFLGRDTAASLWMMLFVVFSDLLPKFLALVAFYHLHEWSPLRDVVGRQWWAWALCFVADDFVYYWFHRANHTVRLFWAGHVSHHSAVRMNFATALRQGVGERLHKYLFWLPLPLLGFDPLMIFTVMSVNLFYQFWLHTEWVRRLPAPVEFIFNTPSHHRVHHGSNIDYLDANHGGVFIIWDRLFGTFVAEQDAQPVTYGLTTNISNYNPFAVAFHDYVALARDLCRAERWGDRWKYCVLSPGWSHDGPDRRSVVLKRRKTLGALQTDPTA